MTVQLSMINQINQSTLMAKRQNLSNPPSFGLSYKMLIPKEGIETGSKGILTTAGDLSNYIIDKLIAKNILANVPGEGPVKVYHDKTSSLVQGVGIFINEKADKINTLFQKMGKGGNRSEALEPLFREIPKKHTFEVKSEQDIINIFNENILPELGIKEGFIQNSKHSKFL